MNQLTNDELRGVIEETKRDFKDLNGETCLSLFKNHSHIIIRAFSQVLELLEQFEKCEGFPEKKIIVNNLSKITSGEFQIRAVDLAFNQARDLCKVAYVKLESQKLSREEFHNIMCEFRPTIAEDSGQPEWTTGELDKAYDFLVGKNKYLFTDDVLRAELQAVKRENIDLGEQMKGIELYGDELKEENTALKKENEQYSTMNQTAVAKTVELLETITALKEKVGEYEELIMAVESKHKGETRHQTALRYIKHAEQGSREPANVKRAGQDSLSQDRKELVNPAGPIKKGGV